MAIPIAGFGTLSLQYFALAEGYADGDFLTGIGWTFGGSGTWQPAFGNPADAAVFRPTRVDGRGSAEAPDTTFGGFWGTLAAGTSQSWTVFTRTRAVGTVSGLGMFLEIVSTGGSALANLRMTTSGTVSTSTPSSTSATGVMSPNIDYSIAYRYNHVTGSFSVWFDGVQILTPTGSAGNLAAAMVRLAFSTNIVAHGVVAVVDVAASDAEIAATSTWLQSLDPTYAGGGVTKQVVVYGLPVGSRAQLFEHPHPQRATIDFDGATVGGLSGTSFNFATLESATEVPRYAYYGTDPATSGRTGILVSLTGVTTAEGIATATAAALDSLTYCTASASGTVVSWELTENGAVEAPADVDTGALLELVVVGGDDDSLVSEVASSSSSAETLSYNVLLPRELSLGIAHTSRKTVWFTFQASTVGYSLSYQADTDQAYDAPNAGLTPGVEYSFNEPTRLLTLNSPVRLDQVYYAEKHKWLNDTYGLRYRPFIVPADYGDAFSLLDADFVDDTSRGRVRQDGYNVLVGGTETDARACLISGSNELDGVLYAIANLDGTPVDISTGPFNGVYQVRDGASLDVHRITVLSRGWDRTWTARDTYSSLQATGVDGTKIYVGADAVVARTVSARATAETWTDVSVSFGHLAAASLEWAVAIDGAGRSVSQVEERCRYLTDHDQTATLDGQQGRVYLGTTLYLPFTGASGFTAGGTVEGASSGAKGRIVAVHSGGLSIRCIASDHHERFEAGEALVGAPAGSGTAGTPRVYQLQRQPLCELRGGKLYGAPGVWISNVSGDVELTAVDGTTYTPPKLVAVEITNVVIGSSVYIQRTDTHAELLKVTNTATSTVSMAWPHGGAPGDDVPIRITVAKQSAEPFYKQWRQIGTITINGYTVRANQEAD